MSLSAYLAAELAKYAFTGEAAAAEPSAWYVALHSADPTPTGASEIASSGYVRQGSVAFTRAANEVRNAGGAISFPAVTGAPYTVTHVSVWTAANGGNMLIYGALAVPKTFAVGEVVSFAANELILAIE